MGQEATITLSNPTHLYIQISVTCFKEIFFRSSWSGGLTIGAAKLSHIMKYFYSRYLTVTIKQLMRCKVLRNPASLLDYGKGLQW